jgi:hypothetical protein
MIDITIPRECIYKVFEDAPGPCPRCGNVLEKSAQTYMVATRRGRTMTDPFVLGSDFGWFCPHCPTVVINPDKVDEMLRYAKPGWDIDSEFAVMGVIDLNAVPPEKAHLPLGGDDNPYPLVQFTNVSRAGGAVASKQLPARSKSRTRKKRPKPAGLRVDQQKRQKKKKRRQRK